jgi:hypothetical protein
MLVFRDHFLLPHQTITEHWKLWIQRDNSQICRARPESATACRTAVRPALQHLLDFLVTGKLAPIRLGYALLDFFNLPLFQIV